METQASVNIASKRLCETDIFAIDTILGQTGAT
jgi:hypothetical protein